ncbi:unnamed protein product [Psylliodes chrysocephalus]|uniref:Uncharacterized protein n=1 Tax=Psylliodes chrysocephalus TaxID=3402493 RepID=A0A9P0CXI8_9CUCU|nr:unnamed protein product [Psylliodes chrysocephala]
MENAVASGSGAQTQCAPERKLNKTPKASIIKMAKVKGEEYINHRGKLIEKCTIGKNCRAEEKQRSTDYPDTLINLIKDHIKSFKPRQSHYSRRKNPLRFCLPEGLTIKDMHSMFQSEYLINIHYKIYYKIFTTNFNLKFGFPRSDTCSQCHSFQQKLSSPEISDAEKVQITMVKELH